MVGRSLLEAGRAVRKLLKRPKRPKKRRPMPYIGQKNGKKMSPVVIKIIKRMSGTCVFG